jgi:hypothetical protein
MAHPASLPPIAVSLTLAVMAAGLAGCSDSAAMSVDLAPPTRRTPGVPPPVSLPETLPREESAVPDDAAVIGVSTGERARAYLVAALTEIAPSDSSGADSNCQIVNDLLGNVPITVTYCARTDLCRVLTSHGAGVLRVAVAGRNANGLEVLVNGQRYSQSDPQLPLQDFAFQTTTWGNWKSQHPQSDIYIGRLDEG